MVCVLFMHFYIWCNQIICFFKGGFSRKVQWRAHNLAWWKTNSPSEEGTSAARKLVCDLWNCVFSHNLKIKHELEKSDEIAKKVIPQSPKKFLLDKL
jgi:hypothetical protein